MKLVTIERPPAGRAGLLLGDDILDFGMAAAIFPMSAWIPTSLGAVIAAGDDGLDIVRRLERRVREATPLEISDLRAEGALIPAATTRLMAPLPRPGILLSHARAYHSHVAEMKGTLPTQPVGFMKNVNAIVGHGAAIVLPEAAPDQVDFEAEISVVFARPCHRVSAEDAMAHVFGFTIVNDVSARDWVPQMKVNSDLNRMGKQFATFAPMGPCIATMDEIPDPANMHLITRLNGAVMQDAWTTDLIWGIPELIAYYAAWHPFQAGDILTTGTPDGVGYGQEPKVFMRRGDVISITVDGIGELANPVVRR